MPDSLSLASSPIPTQPQTPADMKQWTTVITARTNILHIPFREIWEYRELVMRLVHRDFVSRYKQTVLGSAWYVIQPLFTSLMFTLVFNKIAKILLRAGAAEAWIVSPSGAFIRHKENGKSFLLTDVPGRFEA